MYRRRLTPPPGCYLLSKLIYSKRGVLKHKYAQNGGVGECQTTFHGLDRHPRQLTLSHMISTARLRGAVEGTGLSSAITLKRLIHQGEEMRSNTHQRPSQLMTTCTKKRSQWGHVGKEGKGAECEHPTLWDMHGRKTA